MNEQVVDVEVEVDGRVVVASVPLSVAKAWSPLTYEGVENG